MNFDTLEEIITEELTLRKISEQHRQFISDLFQDPDIRKYYIVPKEAQQDYRQLVNYWFNDIANGAGYAWVIYKNNNGFITGDEPCGFFAFEFRDSLKNVRISYALAQNFRKKGIITKSAEQVLKRLIELGVETAEADVDQDNKSSEKVVERLGFKADKHQTLYDPEMMRDGEIRLRFLWKKDINRKPITALDMPTGKFGINAPQNELIAAINKLVKTIDTHGQQPVLINKYFYFLGRIKFNEGAFEEARQAFGQHNMSMRNIGKEMNYETFFWFSRISVEEEDYEMAKGHFQSSVEHYNKEDYHVTLDEMMLFDPN